MNVSVYAICKNEKHFVERFLNSVQPELQDGDNITILDTGSTDGTIEEFERFGVTPHSGTISPWRFDDARNVSLSLVPDDIDVAMCIDLDEVLQPGWREALEDSWTDETTRLRYFYVWNWKDDGSPGISYWADKIHSRHGYRWKLPAHEVLQYVGSGLEQESWSNDLVIHHHADNNKPRSQYLSLMELALREDPTNDRMQHYFARELFFYNRFPESAEWFQKHLDNPNSTWRHERAESMMYLSKMPGNEMWKDMWTYRAAAEAPERRDVWFHLGDREMEKGNQSLASEFYLRANSLPKDQLYLSSGR